MTPDALADYRRATKTAVDAREALMVAENDLATASRARSLAERTEATARDVVEARRAAARAAHEALAALTVAIPGSPAEAAPAAAEAAEARHTRPVDDVARVSRYGAPAPAPWTSDYAPAREPDEPEPDPRD